MAFKKGHPPMGGRPKGATTKPRLSDHLTQQEVDGLVNMAKELALKGDTNMLKFVLEQHFGKAREAMDITTGGEKFPQPLINLHAISGNNSTTQNSEVK